MIKDCSDGICENEYLIERLQRTTRAAAMIYMVSRNAISASVNPMPCPHGNIPFYPTHAVWCDQCWYELEEALGELELDEYMQDRVTADYELAVAREKGR